MAVNFNFVNNYMRGQSGKMQCKNLIRFLVLLWLGLLMPVLANAGTTAKTSPAVVAKTSTSKPSTPTRSHNAKNNALSVEQKLLQTNTEQLREWTPLLPPDIQRILVRGKLLVSMPKADNPPFFAVDSKGEYWGLDVELVRGFAKQMGVEVFFNREAESYDAAVEEVVQRKTDVAWCKLSRTFERAMKVRYTKPYVVLRQALLINRLGLAKQTQTNIPVEETVQKLSGNIGVIANSAYVGYANKHFRQSKVIGYETWGQVIEAVTKGEVVAAYRDELEVKKIIKANPGAALNFKTAVIIDETDPLAIAVAWDSTTLLELINIYLENQKLDLTADKLLDRYSSLLFKK